MADGRFTSGSWWPEAGGRTDSAGLWSFPRTQVRLTRKRFLLLLLSALGLAAFALMYARRPVEHAQTQRQRASPLVADSSPAAYADPAVCSSCHDQIARTFSA